MCPSLSDLRSSLSAFSASAHVFRVLFSVPAPPAGSSTTATPAPQRLYVLDSSFNPPTRAHLRIAASVLRTEGAATGTGEPGRLVLLLATQNADKAPKPAPLEHRLMMMSRLAYDLRSHLSSTTTMPSTSSSSSSPPTRSLPTIDIALTKLPYFHDKARAISTSAFYPNAPAMPQIHLVGFDTLVRILDPKYYPPHHTLAPLAPFLSAEHRLRVAYRSGPHGAASSSSRAHQDEYLTALADGRREPEGGRSEWAKRIELVDVSDPDDDDDDDDHMEQVAVSSTTARHAVRSADEALVRKMLPEGVAEYVRAEKLYCGDGDDDDDDEGKGEKGERRRSIVK